MDNSPKTASKSKMQTKVENVSKSARIMDAVLAVVFIVLAIRSDTQLWQIIWGVSAAFCLFTAIVAPIDKLGKMMLGKLSVNKR